MFIILSNSQKNLKPKKTLSCAATKHPYEEMADMKGKVKWMATKLNEQKRKIIWLSIGLVLTLALAVYLMVR